MTNRKLFVLKILLFIVLFFFLSLSNCPAQTWLDDLTPPPPKSAKQNTSQLFGGFALQAIGLGVCAGSAFLLLQLDEDLAEVSIYGLTAGFTITTVGSVLIIRSVKNIVITRKAYRKVQKSKHPPEISIYIGPTKYGAGIVCAF